MEGITNAFDDSSEVVHVPALGGGRGTEMTSFEREEKRNCFFAKSMKYSRLFFRGDVANFSYNGY